MRNTKYVVIGMSKGSLCKHNKPPLMDEHAFPMMQFVGDSAIFTNGVSDWVKLRSKSVF